MSLPIQDQSGKKTGDVIPEHLPYKLAFTYAEVGFLVGVSASTIRDYVQSGRMRAIGRKGESRRISRAQLVLWFLQEERAVGTSIPPWLRADMHRWASEP
jgi:excisionase family DNA binding protein